MPERDALRGRRLLQPVPIVVGLGWLPDAPQIKEPRGTGKVAAR